jgi:probable F420-dependent oxidoreductase
VRRAEAIGIDTLVVPDHLIPQMAPVPTMAAIAAVSDRLRVAAFVLNNDLRHPAVLAQDLASLDVLSEGRLDVAIGGGWNRPEYEAIGIAFDPTPVRQARLAEAVAVLKGCFADGPFSFAGEHYTITDLDAQPKPVQRPHPPFLIGGGGRNTLTLAAREAQIVGLAPRILPNGAGDPRSITFEGNREKIGWVREAAGERFDDLELNIYPSMTGVSITDKPLREAREVADRLKERSGLSVSPEELLEAPHIFVNTVDGFVEKFRRMRDELGISSIMVGALGELDPVVERLAGT